MHSLNNKLRKAFLVWLQRSPVQPEYKFNVLSTQGPTTELCVTFGNEACDLDSIVCALVYAYYKSTKRSTDDVILPLVQCLKEDLVLNQEAKIVFDMLGIDESWLLYINDISSDNLSTAAKLSLVLVDHNAPTGKCVWNL